MGVRWCGVSQASLRVAKGLQPSVTLRLMFLILNIVESAWPTFQTNSKQTSPEFCPKNTHDSFASIKTEKNLQIWGRIHFNSM